LSLTSSTAPRSLSIWILTGEMSAGGAALQPTFHGHVSTTTDALVLFEACLQGQLSHVPRRPHDRERGQLIRSGSVFIYEENASGIKRWTDGVTWSPSRILGNFLVYRELDKPFPPGEKKRAMKKNSRRPSRPGEPYARVDGSSESYSPTGPQPAAPTNGQPPSEMERQLIGSLIDSYGFKQDGLVKKTMSVTVSGVTHHLVSYYNVNEVLNNRLQTPTKTDNLQFVRPRPELTHKQSFRSPLEEADDMGQHPDDFHGYRMGSAYVPDYRQQQYYMPQSYPSMAPQQQTIGVPYQPPTTSPYLHGPSATPQMQQQRSDYAQYDQSPFARAYQPTHPNNAVNTATRSIPPTPTSMPPMLPERTQPHTMMYSNLQRPPINLSPISTDTRGGMSYRPQPYNMQPSASSLDAQRQVQPSPVQMRHDDRDGAQSNGSVFYSPRPQYSPENNVNHVQSTPYSQPSPMHPSSMHQWPNPNPGQQ